MSGSSARCSTQGPSALIAFIVIGAAALFYQMRDVGQSIQSIDRSQYSY